MIPLLMWLNLSLLTAYYDVINKSYVTWIVITNYNCGFWWDIEKARTNAWYTESPHSIGVWSLKIKCCSGCIKKCSNYHSNSTNKSQNNLKWVDGGQYPKCIIFYDYFIILIYKQLIKMILPNYWSSRTNWVMILY